MQVLIETRAPQAAPMREWVERRLRFTMRRLSARVPRARVHLSDVNGPRGGLDKRCRIELQLDAVGPVVVTSVARDWPGALDLALGRAQSALARQWHRHPIQGRLRVRGSEPG